MDSDEEKRTTSLQVRVSESTRDTVETTARQYGFTSAAAYMRWWTEALPGPHQFRREILSPDERADFEQVCAAYGFGTEEIEATLARAFIKAHHGGAVRFPVTVLDPQKWVLKEDWDKLLEKAMKAGVKVSGTGHNIKIR